VFSVRDAVVADVPAIRAVARPAWHAAYDDPLGHATVDTLVDDWYEPTALRDEVRDGEPFVVAERPGSVVGFAQGGRASEDEEATLSRLYVHPDEWGDGVGTALLGAVARRLPAAETLRAVVLAANGVGHAFYDRHGFAHRGRRQTTLDGHAFEVVVRAAPLGPLREHAPAVDTAVSVRDDETSTTDRDRTPN
jgi:GNAT superfamily N-acetyltransferase